MTTFDITKPHCKYFNDIAAIPHGSFNEEAIADYVVEFAKSHNLEYKRDDMHNVVVYKKASEGYENAKPLILEAHMDMVCEANKSTQFDFKKDSLKLRVEDGWLKATGTTLGADDGTGVSYMLAILDDDTLGHPDLECAFTVQEEVGLCGALALDPSWFKARRMVCLDGGGEVSTAISSAGGCLVESHISVKREANASKTYKLSVGGLTGGHSGGEIHKEKGNANKLVFRILKEMNLRGLKYNLVSVEGGLKDNAIPRECEAVITSDEKFEDLLNSLTLSNKDIATELEFSDAGYTAVLEETDTAAEHFDDATTAKVVNYLFLVPNGFRHRSMAIEGLTLTSLNMGIVRTNDEEVTVTCSLRSAMESGVNHLIDTIFTLASMFDGIRCATSMRYPGWNFKAESEMRKLLDEVLRKNNGVELVCHAGHGGCECGVFAAMSDEMDIITYGPVSSDIHTPEEKLDLESFDRSFKNLKDLVSMCK